MSKVLFAYLGLNGSFSLKDDYEKVFSLWRCQLRQQHIPHVFVIEHNGPVGDELIFHIVLPGQCDAQLVKVFIDFWNYLLLNYNLPEDKKTELAYIGIDNIRQSKEFIKPFLDDEFKMGNRAFE